MPFHAFSSIVLDALIKEMEQIADGIRLTDEHWVEGMATRYHQEMQEQPVIYLTEEENTQTRIYLAWYKNSGVDIAEEATKFIRGEHVAEIKDYLKTKHDDGPALNEHESTDDMEFSFPSKDGAPTCFKEWFAISQVWRLTLARPEISFPDAAFGSGSCLLTPLPTLWETKLDECMQVTDASAKLPIPTGYSLPITRRDIDLVLPTSEINTDLSALLNGNIIDHWIRILVSHRNKRKPGKTVVINPNSLDLAGTTPQEVVEKLELVNADIDLVLFPTAIKEQDHCILVAAFPKTNLLAVYDSLGSKSTKVVQKKCPWIEEKKSVPGQLRWDVVWYECPQQGEELASEVFMLINAVFLSWDKVPTGGYTQADLLFLRRYVAAVICVGELPEIA